MWEQKDSWLYNLKYNRFTSNAAKAFLYPKIKGVERYIFVATTGRSGTGTLNKIFDAIPDAVSEHEPYPILNGDAMVRKNLGDPTLARFLYDHMKSVNIRRMASGKRYYIETNHVFVKSFGEYAVEDFKEKIAVIHLTREPEKVAKSILSLTNIENCYPGTKEGNQWWLDFRAPGNIVNVADVLEDGGQFGTLLYRCLWYWYETEARVAKFKKENPSVRVSDIHVNELKDYPKVAALLDNLGVVHDPVALSNVLKIHANSKPHFKSSLDISDDELNSKNRVFRAYLKSRGYTDAFSLVEDD